MSNSRSIDAMQFFIDLLTSTSGPLGGVGTIGFTPLEELTSSSDKPFIQAYSPIIDNSETEGTQADGTLTFNFDIVDNRSEVARTSEINLNEVLESLTSTIAIDSTLRGIVAHCFISLSTVYELRKIERPAASFVVVCELPAADNLGGSFVNLMRIPLADVPNLVLDPITFAEQSLLFDGGCGIRRPGDTGLAVGVDARSDSFPTVLPVDLSLVTHLRWQVYLDRNASRGAMLPSCTIASGTPTVSGQRFYVAQQANHGWNEYVVDIDDPAGETGTIDLTDIHRIKMSLENTTNTWSTFGLVFAGFGYHLRDRGASPVGVHPGY